MVEPFEVSERKKTLEHIISHIFVLYILNL